MVKVGDRIRLSSMKGADREGVVTAVAGSLLRVRWPSQEETTVVPAPGTLTVLTAGTAGPETAANKKGAVKSAAGAKKTNASKSATPTKSSAKKIKGTQRPKR
jgi:hypothetical protein